MDNLLPAIQPSLGTYLLLNCTFKPTSAAALFCAVSCPRGRPLIRLRPLPLVSATGDGEWCNFDLSTCNGNNSLSLITLAHHSASPSSKGGTLHPIYDSISYSGYIIELCEERGTCTDGRLLQYLDVINDLPNTGFYSYTVAPSRTGEVPAGGDSVASTTRLHQQP